MKTQSSFRKKALLSSTAMLLVAMLALGAATYAWFTNNPMASATGLTLKATSANGLVIQTATRKAAQPTFWGHDDFLNFNGTDGSKTDAVQLNALSFDLSKTAMGTTAYSAEAEADGAAKANDDKAVTTSTAGYYQEKVFTKLTGASDVANVNLKGLTVSFTDGASQIQNAIRIAVTYHDDSGSGTDKLVGVYSISPETGAKYLKGIGATYTAAPKGTADVSAFSATLNTLGGAVHPTGADYFEVTVYLDGEQNDCFTNNVNLTNIVDSVQLDLALAA